MMIRSIFSNSVSAVTIGLIGVAAYTSALHAEAERIDVQESIQEIVHQIEYKEQHYCLSMNLYHEARGDSELGQKAVGWVTLNRVQSQRYPNSICDVVYQARLDSNGSPIRNKCQFSWWCDGKSDAPGNLEVWNDVKQVAHEVMRNYGEAEDVTDGATMYHASYVNPYWASSYSRTVRIDTHIFYK